MEKARIPVKILREGARLPQYGSAFAAGADLYACLEKELTIEPGKSALVVALCCSGVLAAGAWAGGLWQPLAGGLHWLCAFLLAALGSCKICDSLLKSWVDKDGRQHFASPDSVRQQLFVHTPGSDPDEEPDWHEYNPDLRVEANSRAVQDALDYFSFKTGLGTHHYQFCSGAVKTATEYTGDRQDMVQHANRHQIEIEAALLRILRALLWAGKTLLGAPIDPDTPLAINFDDSYITDTGTRRETDRQDVRDGLWPKYRYLMEWRGLSEDDARRAVAEAAEEGDGDVLNLS